MENIIEFNKDDISIENFFETLNVNKDFTRRNNMAVFLGEKFVRILTRTNCETLPVQKEDGTKEVTINYKDKKGNSYKLVLSVFKQKLPMLFRLDHIESTNPEYTDVYKTPNYADDVSACFFTKTSEKLPNIKK